jgi:carbon-monoxide dehydrogenase iron sulfur subunit
VTDNYTYLVTIHPEKCRGCRTCEMACSLSHFNECNPTKSRIRAIRTEESGVLYSFPVLCQQCEEPACLAVCPVGAIYRDPETGAKLVNGDKCIGCRRCVYICPFGGVSVDPETKTSFKCDLCDGDPNCAKFCAFGALEYLRSDKIDIRKKREGGQKILDFQKNTTAAEGSASS